jgi:hypothetical protein
MKRANNQTDELKRVACSLKDVLDLAIPIE